MATVIPNYEKPNTETHPGSQATATAHAKWNLAKTAGNALRLAVIVVVLDTAGNTVPKKVTNKQTNKKTKQKNKQTNKQTNERTNKRTNERTNKQ